MDATQLERQVCEAITRRCLVMFEYGDLIRVVEPHRLGINSAGHIMLSGWLRAGYSRSDPAGGWRNYLLSDIHALQVLAAPFAVARPGYAPYDPRMREVFCQLEESPPGSESYGEGPYLVTDSGAATGQPPERAEPTPTPTSPAAGERQVESAANQKSRRA
jgi:hypothetical protein